jgi:hypothetical protein
VTANRRTHVGASVAYATLAMITGGLALSSAGMLPTLELHDPGLTTVAQETGVPAPESIVTKTSRPRREDTRPVPATLPTSPSASVCVFGDGNCIASAVLLPDVLFGFPTSPAADGPLAPTPSGVPADGTTEALADEAAATPAPPQATEPPAPTDPPAAVTEPADPATDPVQPTPTPSTDPSAQPTGEPSTPVEPSPVDPTPSTEPSASATQPSASATQPSAPATPLAPLVGPDGSSAQAPEVQGQTPQ